MKSPTHHPLRDLLSPPGLTRIKGGHPWLYRTHVREGADPGDEPGLWAVGEGWYFYSPRSEIRLRRLGPWASALPAADASFIGDAERFAQLFGQGLRAHLSEVFTRKRKAVGGETCFRWIFSESDFVPGLVVDVFDGDVVAQIQTAPMERFWPAVKSALLAAYRDATSADARLIEMRNTPVRRKEGLEVIEPAAEDRGRWIRWNGFEWWMNPGGPQKTGAYLDQRDNHLAAARWARALGFQEAWDLCAFEGGFGLHLAAAGLKVWAVDQSEASLGVARRNAERNDVPPERWQTHVGNVFDELRGRHQQKHKTDLIVLDPPSFVRSKADKDGALRGLKELNLRSMHTLRHGGMLVTCTCSHHVGPGDLDEVLREAAHDSRRQLKALETRGPAPDHAPLAGFPESQYLQARYLEVL